MSETMNDKQLTTIFGTVGLREQFDDVQAEFAPFRDFKIKWTRSYRWISFEVSDYLREAPESVIKSLAECVFKKIKGEEGTNYTDDVVKWITSDDFVKEHQSMFARRVVGRNDEEDISDLMDSYTRLVKQGLVRYDPYIMLEWNRNGRTKTAGSSSVLMRYGQLNSALKDNGAPDELLDYCVFSQIVHIQMGFNNTGTPRREEYNDLLNRFPQRSRMEQMLLEMGLRL